MSSHLRISILECDELVGEMKNEFGSIGNLYKTFLEKSASKLEECSSLGRPNIEFSFYDVVKKQEYPNVENIDAVFLTGGRYDSFTPGLNGWILKLVDFTRAILQDQSRVRVLAVCFGHQIVGRAYGVMPERSDSDWELSVTPVSLTERGKQVFGNDLLAIHQMHRDILPRYPASVEKLGSSDRCEVQGIYVKNRVISLQGHPEYNANFAATLLRRRRGSLIDEATYQDAMNRVYNPHHGLTIGASFLKFLLEKDDSCIWQHHI